ncbi:hypothetical protein [Ktedonobacter sp. SOSP1-52]|uniref:hypothetical protein n=1 Tax=Ktedonobacter sp. SOSP1-52 TaxID=2778366 RepID=UPI001916512C|nr:hypothetical protein [Ktedonobacter sp. SOSP1-52]
MIRRKVTAMITLQALGDPADGPTLITRATKSLPVTPTPFARLITLPNESRYPVIQRL